MWDGNLWDFPIQEEQKTESFLLDGEILQWLKTSFLTWLLGWPNLACQRLAVLGEETTELETTLEFLLIAVAVLDKTLSEIEVEVDNSRVKLSWSLRLWKE